MRTLHSRAIPVGVQIFGLHVSLSNIRQKASRPFWLGIILLFVSCLHMSGQQRSAANNLVPSAATPNHASSARNYGKLPLSFEANQGQVDQQVRFLSRGNGYSLFLTNKEAVLALRKPENSRSGPSTNPWQTKPGESSATSFKSDVVRMQLAGASSHLRVNATGKLPGTATTSSATTPADGTAMFQPSDG